MKKNFNDYISLSEKEIDIKFNKVFSKKEKILFDFLLKDKEDILSNNILVPILKIKKLLLLGELENILKIFQKLSEKIIIYTVFKLELIEKKGDFLISYRKKLYQGNFYRRIQINFPKKFLLSEK